MCAHAHTWLLSFRTKQEWSTNIPWALAIFAHTTRLLCTKWYQLLFCHIFVKPGPFYRRDTEPRTIEWSSRRLLHYTFHLLSLPPIVLLSYCLFWHPGQWFDGTPNLGSSFWMIHYDHLPPATWYLVPVPPVYLLWRQKQVADQCEVYAIIYLLLLATVSIGSSIFPAPRGGVVCLNGWCGQ